MNYKFTPPELQTVRTGLGEIAKAQSVLNFFIAHIVRANDMDVAGNYSLSQDGTELIAAPKMPDPPQ